MYRMAAKFVLIQCSPRLLPRLTSALPDVPILAGSLDFKPKIKCPDRDGYSPTIYELFHVL